LGRGFVEPIDDFRASNPAELPALLDELARDFVLYHYDVKRLIRTITGTKAYQVSATPSLTGPLAPDANAVGTVVDPQPPLWSRYPLKPLGPVELLDSIATATDLDDVIAKTKGRDLERAKAQLRKQFSFLFDVDEESHPASYDGTIAQALMLMNGRSVNQSMRVGRHGALLGIVSMPDDEERRIEALYLRTVSRSPTKDEIEGALAVVSHPGVSRLQGYEDLLWAILNSSEFVFNH